jgi:hypothetical protein
MELIIAPLIVLLATGGLALGLMVRGRALQTSCSGLACLPDDARCAGCPKRTQQVNNND